jgi:DNA-binding NarL/FixJ family response regulator
MSENSPRDRSETSVVIVDDNDVVHAGIEAWLTNEESPIKIVGNYLTAAEFLLANGDAPSAVDVVVFGLQYAGHAPEFGALREACDAGHRVIVFSHLINDEIILRSLDAGALTYVAKSESGAHLRAALCAAREGRTYVAPLLARALLASVTAGRPELSARERQTLILWLQTENKDLVAASLFIEPTTVKTHLQRVRAKYSAAGRPASTKGELVARAIQDGIVSAGDL